MKQKIFVIDTNVLLHDPESILQFPNNQVVIPLTVLEELDNMKRLPNELGKNSRAVFRFLDSLHKVSKGDLHQGVELDNGAKLRIQLKVKSIDNIDFPLSVSDNRIIMAAFYLQDTEGSVVFVSKDFAARIKAEALGLEAQDYENLKFSYPSLYRGMQNLKEEKKNIDLFYKDGRLPYNKPSKPNEYFVLTSQENSSCVGKYNAPTKELIPLLQSTNLWGIKSKNVQQKCSIDLLLRDDVKLVTLVGPAGTGKTLLALACGMRKVFDEGVYNKILISRPIVPLGRDIGYLPGTKEEKLFPWMQPIYDNLEILCATTNGADPQETLNWVMESKKIEMEAVTYIRGRSLPKVYMIVDEAQNLTPHEVRTIISRAGEGTKMVFTGDPTQIDNPYLDQDSNGLTYTVGKFSDHALYGNMFLEKTERSELAALAAEIL